MGNRFSSRHIAVVAVAAGVATTLGASAAPTPPKPVHARDFLAAARRADAEALRVARAEAGGTAPRAAVVSLRVAKADLEAALDTVGAAELERSITAAIRTELAAAVGLHGRALAAGVPRSRLTAAVAAAVRHETRAAGLLGNAPRMPEITELPIGLSVFGAFDIAVA